MRFLGNTEARTDQKGRVFLPAMFRKILQTEGSESIVMRKDISQPCLVLYPETLWNEMLDEMRLRLNRYNAQHQKIFRQFVSQVELLTLDGNGRFLIPKRYLQMADIVQGVRFIGVNDAIEIWAVEKTQQPFLPQEEFAEKLKAIMTSGH
jgi:MraZ protein